MPKTLVKVRACLPVHQHLRVVGNCREFGQWSPFESVELARQDKTSACTTYTAQADLSAVEQLSYRYLLCEKLKGNDRDVLTILKYGPLYTKPVAKVVDDSQLNVNDDSWMNGWLLHETEVNLTIHNSNASPIRLLQQSSSLSEEDLRIKISKISVHEGSSCSDTNNSSGVFTKVVSEYSYTVGEQEETGICYDPSKHYAFVSKVVDLNDSVFKVELAHSTKDGDKYDHLGLGFIHPVSLKGSRGVVNVIISKNDLLVGSVEVEYLIIKPLGDKSFHNVGDWPNRNWQNGDRTLHMGHRGCGATFCSSTDGPQENTIESFLTAYEQGSDGLELDVQVTKDLVPIMYHDIEVNTSFMTKDNRKVYYSLPIHQITHKELQEMWIEHTKSEELNQDILSRTDLRRKIAPTLQEVLTSLPEDCPMELEVKYIETEKGEEDDPFVDENVYVDTILSAVFQHIGNRKLILMSFSSVIAQMMNRKQQQIPVKMGICGETAKYPVYKDILIDTVGRTAAFAQCEQLLGLSCFCDHVLHNPNLVNEIKKRRLVLSTWGTDNNVEEIREKQRRMGVDVLCFDRIHEKTPE